MLLLLGFIFIIARKMSFNTYLYRPLIGFVSGFLASFICFEVLPNIFFRYGLYKCVLFVLLGVALAAYFEIKSEQNQASRLTGFTSPLLFGWFADTGISLISGVLLYFCCGELYPETMSRTHRILSVLGALLGFAAEIFLWNFLQNYDILF